MLEIYFNKLTIADYFEEEQNLFLMRNKLAEKDQVYEHL